MATYRFDDVVVDAGDPGFAVMLQRAHSSRLRPKCLCLPEGTDMYVARLGPQFLIKRMPCSGAKHALDCESYEPPAELSGLAEVLGSAIKEDPQSGITSLRLGFPVRKMPGRVATVVSAGEATSARSEGARLSLRGLLHYLWDQAELTRWDPRFEQRRTWGVVRHRLLAAAEAKQAKGQSLNAMIFIPEPFVPELRGVINARRTRQWASRFASRSGESAPLMLLVAELKELAPSGYGGKAVVKHLPDVAFQLEGGLYRKVEHIHADQLALWCSASGVRMITAATFSVSSAGVPKIEELALMPAHRSWLQPD